MKKLVFIMPLMAVSLLASCGGKSNIVVTFDAGEDVIERTKAKKEERQFTKSMTWKDAFSSFDYRGVLKDDYDFLFWSLDGINPISDDYVIDHSITLKPVFAPVNHDYLTFTPRNGECSFIINYDGDSPSEYPLTYSFNEDFSNSHSFFNDDNEPINIKVNIGQRMFVKGTMLTFKSKDAATSNEPATIINNDKRMLYSISGNLNSPLEDQNNLNENAFEHAFAKENIIIAHNLLVGTPNLSDNCYLSLFLDCTKLIHPCKLPNKTLSFCCYRSLFSGCTSLIEAPELPATILTEACYHSMFNNCSSLTIPPVLNSESLYYNCYASMFQNSGIRVAPRLPATTLSKGCYGRMFFGCSFLEEAPELPATVPCEQMTSYSAMFCYCVSLKRVPLLALKSFPPKSGGDFLRMFGTCSSLSYIKVCFEEPMLPNSEGEYRLRSWVAGVAEHGTFVCPQVCADKDTYNDFSENTIPVGWTIDNDMSH